MKNRLFFLSLIVISLTLIFFLKRKNTEVEKEDTITELRKKHKEYLENSPFKETRGFTKKERKARALPPNGFFEQQWDRTLDPSLGQPNFRKALQIQREQIQKNKDRTIQFGVPGESNANPWIERGPDDVGGRTRGIMFDPNDPTNRRVFAGGVSGGLWVNNDITDANSTWSLVQGVPENIAVNQIIFDPNNRNTFYIASGEQYTRGSVIGNGVYRSTDGGANWEQIFGGPNGNVQANSREIIVEGIFYVNDIIARNVSGSTEIYIAVTSDIFFPGQTRPNNPLAILGPNDRGIYRTLDNGNSWNLIPVTSSIGVAVNPNDLELDANNNIWVATTSVSENRNEINGGDIFMSTNGTNFTLINTIPGAARTEIEPSSQNANVFYVAAEINRQADLFITTDAFFTFNRLTEPNDATTPVGDYTRTQAFYDLPIEVDPTDDTILYVGGINLFRGIVDQSRNRVTWRQMSNEVSVHADQHAIVFRPGNSDQAVFGNDGGVYYGSSLAAASITLGDNNTISVRNNNYNVTQFYAGSINIEGQEEIVGASQDNGVIISDGFTGGIESFSDLVFGDGTYAQFDDQGEYLIASNQDVYIYFELPRSDVTNAYLITSTRIQRNFINEAELDTNLDILYVNARPEFGTSGSRIARYSNITNGRENIREDLLTDRLLSGQNISALKVSPFETTSTRLLVGTERGRLINIENADGDNPVFTRIFGPGFLGSISDIEFGDDINTFIVTFSNYGVTSVFYTEDGGATWVSKEGDFPDIPVFSFLQSPLNPNEAIIGSYFGV
ncbi:glycosyl hydrolase [Flavobacteriaceae bacterium R38]|nr:glycosyl hydrolase [Flavobacteriaceae bacterium R38]